MNVQEAIIKRRSIRKFLNKNIPDEAIEELIEALRWAPSAGNLQSRYFYFVYNKEIKEKLAEAAFGQKFLATAPLVIVICADLKTSAGKYSQRGKDLYSIIDASLSVENLFLQAVELGLGCVWVGAFDENKVAEILDLPENLKPIGIIPVGYPAENPKPTSRKKNEEILKIIK
jgi:nitroreductase